jgi:xylitol oxidase
VGADLRNWAGNVAYRATRVVRPRTVEEVQQLVAGASPLRPLGTRHSFTDVADTEGTLLSTERLDQIVEVSPHAVTVEPGIRYGELGGALRRHGLAVANMASLPHISVGGAVATATHGSGVANGSLSSAVSALDLVAGDGTVVSLRRGDDGFDGAVAALGALGVVVRATLDVVPAFPLRQTVFRDLPWAVVATSLDAILAGGYSVSLFTTWTGAGIDQVWVKTATERDPDEPYFGAPPAAAPVHPVRGADPANCTEQLGVPGPSDERLPHFRLGFTPSAGEELQSEYIVRRTDALDALAALRKLGPVVSPLLFVSEIRAIASDTLWLSPFYERDAVAFHFTWKPLASRVVAVLPQIEAALAPFDARPHWGKLFTIAPETVERLYPRLPDFRALRGRLDPAGCFRNDFVDRYVGQFGT